MTIQKDTNKLPEHIGIIMDGNGRWATRQGKNRSIGHRAGANTMKELCAHMNNIGIKYVSLYAFSTENFKRSYEEVSFLMNLFIELFNKELITLEKQGIKVVFSGRRENLSEKVLGAMDKITEKSKNNKGLIVNICLNYGSQFEMVDMVKKISSKVLDGLIDINSVDEKLIYDNLYQTLPPLDLIIRTSGEIRLSNFMMYQASYSELYFTEVLFPDFSNEEFDKAIDFYNNRERKFGGLNEKKSN